MKTIYEDWELEYIRDNYKDMTYKEITNELNKTNKIKKDSKQIRTKASTIGLSKKKYKFDDKYFEKINTEDKAYWLGFIYADGFIFRGGRNYEVGIQLKDTEYKHLEKFNSDIKGNFKISYRTMPESNYGKYTFKERAICKIRIYSKKMYNDLENQGVLQNKTDKEEFPIVDDSLFIHFLRGFFDGDGHIYYKDNKNKSLGITNPNIKILEYIKNKLKEDYNISANIYKEKDKKYRFYVTKTDDYFKLLDKMYENANIYLDRKYEKYISLVS